ncbi:MAG TPA: hypothetical protein V6D23_20055 [Candidatus Obscuribacterales bacterium]
MLKLRTLFATALLLTAPVLTSAPALAEPSFNLDVWQGAKVYYQPGFAFLDTGALNQSIAPSGYANYSGTFLSQGGGVQVILDRIVIGGSGYSLNGFRTASGKGDTLGVSSGYGLLNLGYVIFKEQNFSLYPILGIGSGSVRLSSSEALNKLFGFVSSSDVFDLQSSQVVLDLGLGADYLLDFNGDPNHASGLLVGLKLGYVFVPSPPQWESGGRPVGGSVPNLNAQGPYLSLSLGVGTQREQQTSGEAQPFN